MPHVAKLVHRANRLLDGTDAQEWRRAKDAVDHAETILEAVDRAGLLEQLGEPARAEAHTALEALPATVDVALLAALKSALHRRLPVVIQWKPGTNVELQVWEATEGEVGHVGVLLITPYARVVGVAR